MKEEKDFWAILELFGHTILAGKISKCEIAEFVQINIPETKDIPAWSKMISPKAIYAITPCTEKVAKDKAESLKSMPIDRWDTDQLFKQKFAQLVEDGKIKKIDTQEVQESDDELIF